MAAISPPPSAITVSRHFLVCTRFNQQLEECQSEAASKTVGAGSDVRERVFAYMVDLDGRLDGHLQAYLNADLRSDLNSDLDGDLDGDSDGDSDGDLDDDSDADSDGDLSSDLNSDLHSDLDKSGNKYKIGSPTAPVNRKGLSTEEGTVLNGTILHQLYLQRDRAEKKREAVREARAQKMSQPLSLKNRGKAPQQRKVSVHFEESEGSSIAEASLDESGYEMEDWESDLEAPLDPDSSVELLWWLLPCP
ncbi:hypothetical protein EV426DRAFT_720854 [Tirmania nivea]|nr:hypothetical protein EV426DRAFT_720854 [Tirmania nivea]